MTKGVLPMRAEWTIGSVLVLVGGVIAVAALTVLFAWVSGWWGE